MDHDSDGVTAYARAVAPSLARLARATRGHEALAALLRDTGLAHTDVLIATRGFLLTGPFDAADLVTIDRALSPEAVSAALAEYARRGLVAPLGKAGEGDLALYTSTLRGRDLLLRLTALQGAAVTALWAPQGDLLPALVSIATRVVGTAAATLPLTAYPAFRRQQAASAPFGATPAHLLLTRLVALHALRGDAMRATWRAYGLDARQACALAAVCCAEGLWPGAHQATHTGEGDPDDGAVRALGALHARRLVGRENGYWHITTPGRTLHTTIEQEIDRRTAPPFAAIEAHERAVFLLGVKKLPG